MAHLVPCGTVVGTLYLRLNVWAVYLLVSLFEHVGIGLLLNNGNTCPGVIGLGALYVGKYFIWHRGYCLSVTVVALRLGLLGMIS